MSIKAKIYQILSYNNTILLSNNTNNIPDNETSPYVSEENENNGYLYLLIIDLLIFTSLTYITYNISKAKQNQDQPITNENKSNEFRIYLIKWLVIANGVRTLSLIFIIIISNPNGNNGISWINSVLHVLPAFVFVTSYINLAIMLSDAYYYTEDYTNHILKPMLIIMINSGYVILTLVAIITLLAKAYKAFFYISELLMALLYLVLGSVMAYFGKKAYEALTKNENNINRPQANNMRIMSISIGALFLLKGICGILEGIGAYSPPNHNVFDFLWFLILEILPTIIYIYFSKLIYFKSNYNIDTPRSTLNENEMMSQMSNSYRPPFEKD